MVSYKLIAAAAGACSFIGYCIYFDRKRRSDPLYKQKIRERRLKASANATSSDEPLPIQIPNLNNPQAVQQFVFTQMAISEQLLAIGDITNAVEHLAYALIISGQGPRIIQAIQGGLPPEVLQLTLARIPVVQQKISEDIKASGYIEEVMD